MWRCGGGRVTAPLIVLELSGNQQLAKKIT